MNEHGYEIEIEPRGPFSLEAAHSFGFGARHPAPWHGVMRMAFVADDLRSHVAVALRQDGDGCVRGRVRSAADPAAVTAQVARILALDHDGDEWLDVGRRDPVIGALQERYPGLRPVLFSSPFEGAAWSILSMRQSRAQGRRLLRAMAESAGSLLDVDGEQLAAFPLPQQLRDLESLPGLAAVRLERLKAVSTAALDGRLDPQRLAAGDPDAVLAELRAIDGVGPFTAGLMLLRASGASDVESSSDRQLLEHARRLYGERIADDHDVSQLAATWAPFRTWATVLVRVDAARRGIAEAS